MRSWTIKFQVKAKLRKGRRLTAMASQKSKCSRVSKAGVEISTMRSLLSYQFKGGCPIVLLLISVPIHVGGIQGQGC